MSEKRAGPFLTDAMTGAARAVGGGKSKGPSMTAAKAEAQQRMSKLKPYRPPTYDDAKEDTRQNLLTAAKSKSSALIAEEQEGTDRLMSFAMGIGRCCKAAGISYGDLAKAANIDENMLAPSLASVMATAAESLAANKE
jgi:hypothetical protein